MELSFILYVLLLSIFIGSVFIYLFRIRGPWGRGWAFMLILFLGIWAAGLWLTPIGPTYDNIYWVPMLFSGLVIAFLLAAATPHSGGKTIVSGRSALNAFFWIFLLSLIVIIALGLFMKQ